VLAQGAGNGQLISSDVVTPPVASNVNYGPGSVDPNVAVATIGVDGRVCFVNSDQASVHLVVDHLGTIAAGSFRKASSTGAPVRIVDTRVDVPVAAAALGDSITRAFHSGCGLLNECPQNSWSTGSAVHSHVARLEGISGSSVRGDNLAATGAVAADLASQATGIAPDTGYVTVLVGANDACTDTVAGMTPVADFRNSVEAALGVVHSRAPGASVYVVSVPDIYGLWQVGNPSASARTAWSLYGICQSMLDSPLSTQPADIQRRQTVRQRVIDFNAALAAVCADYLGRCIDDGGALFSYPFDLGQLSAIDYFHPNVTGQQALASVTWDAGYPWSSAATAQLSTEVGDSQRPRSSDSNSIRAS
jgi:lysophospholipase L1-like esterase